MNTQNIGHEVYLLGASLASILRWKLLISSIRASSMREYISSRYEKLWNMIKKVFLHFFFFAAWIMGWFMCKTVPYVQGVSVAASVYSLCAVSVDRWVMKINDCFLSWRLNCEAPQLIFPARSKQHLQINLRGGVNELEEQLACHKNTSLTSPLFQFNSSEWLIAAVCALLFNAKRENHQISYQID